MEFFRFKRDIPFMRHALVFNIISLVTFLLSVFFLATRGLHFGIDFTGGTLMEVSYQRPADLAQIRERIAQLNLADVAVQNYGSASEVLIRLPVTKGEDNTRLSERVMHALAAPEFRGKLTRTDAGGGVRIEIVYPDVHKEDELRNVLTGLAFEGFRVSERVAGREFVVDVPPQPKASADQVAERVMQAVTVLDYDGKLRRVEFVGPQVGRELVENGALALLFVSIGIVLYLWLRFEWKFGLAAIVANLHDVVIILGFFAFFQWDFSLPVLAAVLAVLGYSVNESVVVFDRIRENFRKMRRASVPEIIDNAITATMSRTIITHGSTQMMVTSMLIFGGETLFYFSLALTIGICFGIYSSVLVASPLVMWLGIRREDLVKPEPKKRDEAVV